MKETGILFKPEMVRAILDGQKTQTRRVVKHIPILGDSLRWCAAAQKQEPGWVKIVGDYRRFCHYGTPGSRLWVRETWAMPHGFYLAPASLNLMKEKGKIPVYRATDNPNSYSWRPSIHMPRWACRLVLEVTDVRVERVQDITEDDAKSEGVTIHLDAVVAGFVAEESPARMEFWSLWNSIHQKDGFNWDANPWVWVITFKILEDNKKGQS